MQTRSVTEFKAQAFGHGSYNCDKRGCWELKG